MATDAAGHVGNHEAGHAEQAHESSRVVESLAVPPDRIRPALGTVASGVHGVLREAKGPLRALFECYSRTYRGRQRPQTAKRIAALRGCPVADSNISTLALRGWLRLWKDSGLGAGSSDALERKDWRAAGAGELAKALRASQHSITAECNLGWNDSELAFPEFCEALLRVACASEIGGAATGGGDSEPVLELLAPREALARTVTRLLQAAANRLAKSLDEDDRAAAAVCRRHVGWWATVRAHQEGGLGVFAGHGFGKR